jgi:hypothetical protein
MLMHWSGCLNHSRMPIHGRGNIVLCTFFGIIHIRWAVWHGPWTTLCCLHRQRITSQCGIRGYAPRVWHAPTRTDGLTRRPDPSYASSTVTLTWSAHWYGCPMAQGLYPAVWTERSFYGSVTACFATPNRFVRAPSLPRLSSTGRGWETKGFVGPNTHSGNGPRYHTGLHETGGCWYVRCSDTASSDAGGR